jgi:hypothetical protein
MFLANNMKKKDVWWWKEGIITIFCETFIVHKAHCGRLWVVEVEDVERQVQVTLADKLINILTWNFNFLNSFLFYFLQELRNPVLFVHCGCYNQKLEYPSCKSTCLCQTSTWIFQLLVTAVTEYKKHWISQILQKIE